MKEVSAAATIAAGLISIGRFTRRSCRPEIRSRAAATHNFKQHQGFLMNPLSSRKNREGDHLTTGPTLGWKYTAAVVGRGARAGVHLAVRSHGEGEGGVGEGGRGGRGDMNPRFLSHMCEGVSLLFLVRKFLLTSFTALLRAPLRTQNKQ